MSTLGRAMAIAAAGFKDTLDRGGQPYFMHCYRVFKDIHSEDEDENIAAILHDCIEDGVCSIADLVREGFSERIIFLLTLLTHDKKTSYDEYIKRVSTDESATKIKKADLRHNSSITRLKGLSKKDIDRMGKYHRSYVYLSKV